MSRFKKKKDNSVGAINTSSLPDIIFMLLFFFMVTTVMREVELIVKNKPPEASEVQKLERKALVSYIYIGEPVARMKAKWGEEPRIQLNESFKDIKDIKDFIAGELDNIIEGERKLHTTSLKVHYETKMGIVTDVKQELRKIGAFKINYSTRKKQIVE
ncbi:MAG: biopolymer transporter ExbD [Saprospiraceae bacterium]|nr:biopolymer transporter ExbD [Saprospiraceae bacterium]